MAVNTMKKGALDFIQKPFNEEDLVSPGRTHAGPCPRSLHRPPAGRQPRCPALQLTTREAQVLERIVAGRLNKQIADDLGISIKTVEAHRANVMEKLNANTVADLLKIALGENARQGLRVDSSYFHSCYALTT